MKKNIIITTMALTILGLTKMVEERDQDITYYKKRYKEEMGEACEYYGTLKVLVERLDSVDRNPDSDHSRQDLAYAKFMAKGTLDNNTKGRLFN